MALLGEDVGKVFLGIGIGLGIAILGRTALDPFREAGRPLLKAAVKGGIRVYERAQESLAEIGEVVEDVVYEVRAEMEQEQAERSTVPEPPAAPPPPSEHGDA